MRLIGHLPDEGLAKRFSDYMLVRDLECQVEPEPDGRWAVWIIDDEHLETGSAQLTRFQSNPDDDKYQEAATTAEERRDKDLREKEAFAKRQFARESIWPRSIVARAGKCTITLVVISAVAFVAMQFDERFVRKWLSIVYMNISGDTYSFDSRFLYDVRHGQVWRLVSPIFLHFGIMHIAMNMWLLVDLGGAVERRYGTGWTCTLVLVMATFSNTLEYAFHGPGFGGMSGVVFGLFGFVLVQSKYNPFSNFYVSPLMTGILLFWFVYCIVGLPGEIANFVHWGGLASGAGIGYVCSQYSLKRPTR